MKILFTNLLLLSFMGLNAQGLVEQAQKTSSSADHRVHCGSYDLMKHQDNELPGFIENSDQMLKEIQQITSHQKGVTAGEVFEIPVVFHVVHNTTDENIPDSVFTNQLRVLNECFRRQNSDTTNLRTEFQSLVGDTRIEFIMAKTDPTGAATNGITHTSTDIEHFGGTLPYGPGQNSEILKWISDSLFYNFFRIADGQLGGHDPWDITRYLNIWIGDLRIYEPKFNNFEELVYLALATPPVGHEIWPDSLIDLFDARHQGVLMHYAAVGPNNPSKFLPPYNTFDGLVNTGKLMVHEVGHYLGLRHIWGDGDCSFDDFVDDTPRSPAASQYDCNSFLNTCRDTINGADLPNMIENYMDYSSGDCQNSFTKGQIAIMRSVMENYRSPLVSVQSLSDSDGYVLYPNPGSGHFSVTIPTNVSEFSYRLFNAQGKRIQEGNHEATHSMNLEIEGAKGLYYLELVPIDGSKTVIKILKI